MSTPDDERCMSSDDVDEVSHHRQALFQEYSHSFPDNLVKMTDILDPVALWSDEGVHMFCYITYVTNVSNPYR